MRFERRRCSTHHHSEFPPERIAAERNSSVTVCVPARDEAETIGPIVRDIVALRERGVVDQVLVADHDSADGTGQIAAGLGAEVVRTGALMRELGPPTGKGDNLWRALTAVRGEVVCFVDGDSADFGPHFVCGLIGPLLCEPGTEY